MLTSALAVQTPATGGEMPAYQVRAIITVVGGGLLLLVLLGLGAFLAAQGGR